MRYLPVLSEALGTLLSSQAWQLAKPLPFQLPGDITKQYGSTITHPVTGAFAWAFSHEPVAIHPEADPLCLDPVILPLILGGYIPAEELQATHAKILAARGKMATVLEIMPPQYGPMVKTFEQMDAEGWFIIPEETQPEVPA